MHTIRARLARVRRFGRMVTGLIVGSVALVTAVAYWENRLGFLGIGVIAAVGGIALLSVVALSDRAWARLTGIDTLANDLGELHAEGALLRHELPWVPDSALGPFPEWQARTDDWFGRVQDRLAGTQWYGTLLSPVSGFRTTVSGYAKTSAYRNGLDDKLERLSQIIIALGGRS